MKNLMKTFGILTLFALITFVSCKKNKDEAKPEKKEQLFALSFDIQTDKSAVSSDKNTQKGIIVGTKQEMEELVERFHKATFDTTQGTSAAMISSGHHYPIYHIEPTYFHPTEDDIYRTCKNKARKYFLSQSHQNQAKANATCKAVGDFYKCERAYGQATLHYFVRSWEPTDPPCALSPDYHEMYHIKLYPFTIDYDGSKINEYIENFDTY